MVRLVKGAYWDSEVKRAQERGFEGYPVFTRKASTDVSYLACAKALIADQQAFYPSSPPTTRTPSPPSWNWPATAGTSNSSACTAWARRSTARSSAASARPACRVYAPVGRHEDLLAYLVRRLLENGANTSFVNRLVDEKAPIDDDHCRPGGEVAAPAIQAASRAFRCRSISTGPSGRTSAGIDLSDPALDGALAKAMEQAAPAAGRRRRWSAASPGAARRRRSRAQPTAPRRRHWVATADGAMVAGCAAARRQGRARLGRDPGGRARGLLDRAADLMEQHRAS
jgi:RHH-type proline utilization regulon transcriptional repressor/proline dehydrogenase/delta 1-pyrroline-5-carboxylate dehydrogenase